MGNDNSTPTRPAQGNDLQVELQAARAKTAKRLQAIGEKKKRDKLVAEELERDAAVARAAGETAAAEEARLARQAAAIKRRAEAEATGRQAAADKEAKEKAEREADEARRTKEVADIARARQLDNAKKLAEQRAAAAKKDVEEKQILAARQNDATEKAEVERIKKENTAKQRAALDKRLKSAQREINMRTLAGPSFSQGSEEGEIRDYDSSSPVFDGPIPIPFRQAPSNLSQSKPNGSRSKPYDTLAGWNPRKEKSAPSSRDGRASSSDEEVAGSSKQRTDRQDSKKPLFMSEETRNPVTSLFPKEMNSSVGKQPELGFKGANNRGHGVKRRAPASAFEDERRRTSYKVQRRESRSGYRSSSASPRSPMSPATGDRQPPEWYQNTIMKKEATRGKNTSSQDVCLKNLKAKIDKIKKAGPNLSSPAQQEELNKLRHILHEAAFLDLDEKLVKGNRILDNQYGLPQLFDSLYAGGIDWPWDIRCDSEELYNRWAAKDFSTDMLRGLCLGAPAGKHDTDRSGDSIDPSYPAVSSKYVGGGKLVNGQWWPTLMCALRDGAHGQTQAGISGEVGKGAYSCIISGGDAHQYPDIDEGDVVYYCGTDDQKRTGQITQGTALMKKSKIDGIPVRFIRSHKGPAPFAPQYGFRYDGLYDVREYECLDPRLQRWRFKLERRPGQGPIRYQGMEKRPTQQEVDRFKQDKRFRGFKTAT